MAEALRHPASGPDAPAVSAPRAGLSEAAGAAAVDRSAPRSGLSETDALAFAVDGQSERALVEGLAGCRDAQVWPGGLRAAAAALGQGQSAGLLVVDIDAEPYPAGAIHELAAVCEAGTVVIALGSDGSARLGREVLLAGVSDYLVKPVAPGTVAAAAARALRAREGDAPQGRLVGFAGTGGTGATTLAAATALVAAARGRYVSVLDLSRTVSAVSLLLDVEPASGLVDLLSTVARASVNPDMVERMRAARSDRIGVYGHAWGGTPPPLPPVWAVCELLVELQRRSHLVIVDGMDDLATRQALLALVDVRVLVMEPTASGALAGARMTAGLGPLLGVGYPSVLVQNHTRVFGNVGAATQRLRRAGVVRAPEVVVPFEPSLPGLADRGFPRDRLPAAFRAPLDALVDRLLAPGAAVEAEAGEAMGEATGLAATGKRAAAKARARSVPSRTRRPRGKSHGRLVTLLRGLPRTGRPRGKSPSATPARPAPLGAMLRKVRGLRVFRGRGLQSA